MSGTIVDRRLNPNKKSLGNRQRFIERHKDQIKKHVGDAINDATIKNIGKGGISMPIRGTKEPVFSEDQKTGSHRHVVNGNRGKIRGDTIDKPSGGSGRGKGNKASDSGEGEDEFIFTISPDELLTFFFEDLELPDLAKKQIAEISQYELTRRGYTNSGSPANLHLSQSYKKALGRRIALGRPSNKALKQQEQLIEQLVDEEDEAAIAEAKQKLQDMKRKQKGIPWIDQIDLRYRHFVPEPKPSTQAVMFCTMDVSGSMSEREKDMAKRFYLLMYILLTKKYKDVDIIFIRHTTEAQECDQETFFYGRESGGTLVSPALKLVNEIIAERYDPVDWNIYVAHASDGDNWGSDNEDVVTQLKVLLPQTQYYAYIDIPNEYSHALHGSGDTDLWQAIAPVAAEFPQLQMKRITNKTMIWSVFKELFERKATKG